MGFAWFTAIDSAEEVGVPVRRILMVEQQARNEDLIVALHLEGGIQIHVVESLEMVRERIATASTDPSTGLSSSRITPALA